MKVIQRELATLLKRTAKDFGALVLSGPRRAGKTYLLRQAFSKASYHLLEAPDVLDRVRADPRGFLEQVKLPAILDEIQNTPELFPYIRAFIDEAPRKKGQWLLAGSQDVSLMAGVTESMAGRAAIFQLAPLSLRELGKWDLLKGGFPEVHAHPRSAAVWFRSYLQTYLERDIRQIREVRDLTTFRRFLQLLASRHGQLLNRTDLAAPLGLSVPTIDQWVSLLETTGQILVVPPYFDNFGKRLIKSPKVYWMDSGLVCSLLGIETMTQLEASPFLGSVFEGFIASEIVKNQIHAGRAKELYYFRDQQGLEVDFLVPRPGNILELVEVKWSKTVTPLMVKPMLRLQKAMKHQTHQLTLVHRAPLSAMKSRVVAPGASVLSVEEFLLR